jgi:hypothetical protein
VRGPQARSTRQGAAFIGYRHIPGSARTKADERRKYLSGEMSPGPVRLRGAFAMRICANPGNCPASAVTKGL